MTIDALSKIVEQLSKRVDALEASGYRFWLPVGISILAVLVSLYASSQGKKQSLAARLQGVKNNIDLAKAQLESLSMEIAPLKAKKSPTADEKRELELKLQVYESVLERVLNAYNDGCDRFFKKQVKQQDFMDLYHQDIRDYVEKLPDKFQPPLTRFDYIVRYYEEKHKKAKA